MTALLSVFGGVLSLDATSFGQFLLARPLIASILTGWLLGDPFVGVVVGAVLEAMSLPSIPAGGAQAPDGAPAAVVGTWAVAAVPGGTGLVAGLLVAVIVAYLGQSSVDAMRKVHLRMVERALFGTGALGLQLRVGAFLLLDLLRGSVVTLVGLVFFDRLLRPALEPLASSGGTEWSAIGPYAAAIAFALFWLGVVVRGWRVGAAGWTTLLSGALLGLVIGTVG